MPSPLALVQLYLTQLWTHLSVIQQANQQKSLWPATTNRTYLLTAITFIVFTIYGTIGLHWESGRPLTLSSLRSSPFIFWRLFFIKQTWPQLDISWIVAYSGVSITLLDFALKDSIGWQHQFTLGNERRRVKLGGKDVSIFESDKLVAMFQLSRIAYKLSASVTYALTLSYVYMMVFFVTKVYLASVLSLTFWFFAFPFMNGMATLFIVANLVHVIVSGSCIQIRQQYLGVRFRRFLTKLDQKRPLARRFGRIWRRYLTLNRSALSICQQLQAFNVFWINYLTVVFLQYTLFQVMFSYVVFFAPSETPNMKVLKGVFTVGILEMAILLFGLIQFCARVVKKNGQIGRLNRRFAVYCLQNQSKYQLRVRQLLKIETLQWPRLLHFYAFKLFGNSRITSKTFYAIAINTVGFFLFVTKQMH